MANPHIDTAYEALLQASLEGQATDKVEGTESSDVEETTNPAADTKVKRKAEKAPQKSKETHLTEPVDAPQSSKETNSTKRVKIVLRTKTNPGKVVEALPKSNETRSSGEDAKLREEKETPITEKEETFKSPKTPPLESSTNYHSHPHPSSRSALDSPSRPNISVSSYSNVPITSSNSQSVKYDSASHSEQTNTSIPAQNAPVEPDISCTNCTKPGHPEVLCPDSQYTFHPIDWTICPTCGQKMHSSNRCLYRIFEKQSLRSERKLVCGGLCGRPNCTTRTIFTYGEKGCPECETILAQIPDDPEIEEAKLALWPHLANFKEGL